MSPEFCPQCGGEVPAGAPVCPECGSSEETGWSEEATADRLDLPGREFDYDDYIEREFGGSSLRPRGIRWAWWIVAVGLVGLFLMWILG